MFNEENLGIHGGLLIDNRLHAGQTSAYSSSSPQSAPVSMLASLHFGRAASESLRDVLER